MIIEAILPAARERLFILGDEPPLVDAAKLLRDVETDIVVVCKADGSLAGVITKSDIVRQISHCQGASCMAAASAVMTKAVAYCHPNDLLTDIWAVMKERHLRNVPILGPDFRPIGMLNARDALEALLEELKYEEILLRDYVMCVGYH